MKKTKLNFGFMKVERHIPDKKPDKKFIKIERNKEPYRHTLESSANIDVLPSSLQYAAKKEETIKPKLHKPKAFSRLIKEIDLLFDNVIVFNAVLLALILFLSSYIILMLLRTNTMYAFFAPAIYLSAYLFIKLRENKYIKVEKKYPELNEKIRTAVDNIYTDNPVVNELREEVSRDIKGVDYAGFFKEKRSSYKIMLIILLCFGMLFLAKYDVGFELDMRAAFSFIEGGEGNATGIVSDIISATTSGPDEAIFGEEYLAELGDEVQTISMNRAGYEINMDDVKDPSLKDFEQSLFPEDVGIEKAGVYVQKDLEEHKELVKNYFKNMAES